MAGAHLLVMVSSAWKFILFSVFRRITSNLMCLTFSTLRSSYLGRIVTIFSFRPPSPQKVLEKI